MHIDWWTLGLQAVNFLVLVWLLHRFLYKPVMAVIARRQNEAEKAFSEAAAAESGAEEARQSFEASRAAVEAERTRMIEETRAQLEGERREIMERARQDAHALVAAYRKTLARERDEAVSGLQSRASDLAVALASHLLRETGAATVDGVVLDRICRHFETLPPSERDDLRGQLVDGHVLRVVTAAALDEQTAAHWRDRLRGFVGDDAPIEFAVDAELIGGAELYFPTAIVRFSWRDALAVAREELKVDAVD